LINTFFNSKLTPPKRTIEPKTNGNTGTSSPVFGKLVALTVLTLYSLFAAFDGNNLPSVVTLVVVVSTSSTSFDVLIVSELFLELLLLIYL